MDWLSTARRRTVPTDVDDLDYRALTDHFEEVLIEASAERQSRPDMVEDEGTREPGWVVHERAVMRQEVDSVRAARAMPPISDAAMQRAEALALGHSDYTRKFALGCADLSTTGRSE